MRVFADRVTYNIAQWTSEEWCPAAQILKSMNSNRTVKLSIKAFSSRHWYLQLSPYCYFYAFMYTR